ncbi:hypothetical protein BC477_16070 [Clavibacter michiganensis subsp. michiganensis]|uniref:Uncharacterized protein n=1 Tax=Clavibacter michiganensis subsp. michiganensis TaxID=33013 RepID=A0A251XGB7_CLAMM|nr:hypothetical protein BC477_16070 [Clavibacter michiganensis subsp. michiganensis]OUE01324.1 hypothetical protein CMMCAS07_13525 [Clavibacter michiganensis subsp. michiganensis]
MLAVKTMNGDSVMPKMAGIESRAKIRSVVPIDTNTITMGVSTLRPSITVRTFAPSKFGAILRRRRRNRMNSESSLSSSSSPTACFTAV